MQSSELLHHEPPNKGVATVAVVAAVEAQVVVLSVRMVLQVVVLTIRAKICADALALSLI